MELEDEIMFDLDAYLEASDMTGSGLSALRCRSCRQWRSQEFRSGGARLKDKIGSKKLI